MKKTKEQQIFGPRRIAIGSAAAGLVAAGLLQEQRGSFVAGGIFMVLAALTVVLEMNWGSIGPVLESWRASWRAAMQAQARKAVVSKSLRRTARRGAAPARRRATAERAVPLWPGWRPALAAFSGWKPLPLDEMSFARYWLLAPLLPLGVLLQVGWAGGKMVLPMLCLGAIVLVVAVYLQDREQPLVLPELNANLRAVLGAGLGLPLQLWGAWLMWQYRFEMTGFLILAAGGAWSLWSLSRWPLRLATPEDEAFKGDEWALPSPRPFYSWQHWQAKIWLIGGALICGYSAMFIYAASNQTLSVSLGFLGIFLLMASFPWLPGPLAPSLGLPKPWQPAVALGLAAAAVLAAVHGQTLVEQNQTSAGLWYFLAAGVAGALACAPRPLEGRTLAPEAAPSPRLEVALLLSLVLLAWLFRIWKIDTFPYAAEGDEAGGGVWAWDILHGNYENPLITSNVPQHYFAITALFFKLFGLSVGSMRLHAVVFGTLSVVSAYLFFRLISGWAAALLATLLMMFSYWHIHFSRFGHYNMEQVYTQLVAFYFVFKGLRNGRYWHFVAAGVAFGLAMQPHLASRLLPFEGIALVLYLALTARPNLRRHANGLLAFVVASWIISSPSLMYWFRASSVSFARAGSVSIFDKTNTNAPPDVLAGFVANSKASMLMFNQTGDSRTRDNPLAPEKMLETGMAVLFALAFAYALYHWREPARFFLLAVFFINLSASVFSVEAPQSLRTAGNIPVVFAFMALWMGDLAAGLAAWGRKRAALVFLALGLPLTVAMCWHSAYKYFVQQAGLCFDVSPTYVGIAVGKVQAMDPAHPTRALLVASGYAATHPPVILFKQGTEMRNHYDLCEFLPPVDIGNKNLMLIFSDDYQQELPYVESLFPDVVPQVISNTSRVGGPIIATYLRIPMEVLAKHHGLRARALVDGRWVDVPNAPLGNADPALAGASRIEWQGGLEVRHYARVVFSPEGGGRTSIVVDSSPVAAGKELLLAQGMHNIKVDWVAPPGGARFQLDWTGTPVSLGVIFNCLEPWKEALPKDALWMDQKSRGFYGHYYSSPNWRGTPVAETVEPILFAHWLDSPILGTWSARFKARFQVATPGRYHFRTQAMVFGEVRVNNVLVARTGAPLLPELTPPKVADGIDLKAGWNTVELRMATNGPPWYDLRWSGPGMAEQLMQSPDLEPVKD
jgi:hypothetical protein